jgi:hypothetical protein
VLAVDSKIETQLIHFLEKPMCCSKSSTKGQLTKSNAFALLTLRSNVGQRRACRSMAIMRTTQKLSCIALPLMKALWLGATSLAELVD